LTQIYFLADPAIFTVESTGNNAGVLKIKAIDRDVEPPPDYKIKIVAKEVNDATSKIEQEIQIIINDINDITPSITPATLVKTIEEGHAGLIDFGEIKIVDPDLVRQ
jgi:hypothetical protein